METCVEAGDAAAAMVALEKQKPDLAIVDITLPDTHGLELVKDIRARYPIPVFSSFPCMTKPSTDSAPSVQGQTAMS